LSTACPENASFHSAERRSVVLHQYEERWGGTYQKAARLLASGETDLSRIHLFMRPDFGEEFQNPALREKFRSKERDRRRFGFLYDRQWLRFHDVESRLTTKMLDAVKMQEIINACDADIGRVIETGSGWGKTLFNVWLHGGPRDAQYWSLELTEAGRRTTELLAEQVAQGMDIRAHHFDYHEPDFSYLRDNLPTVVFTHHSVEQIPQISEAYFDALLAIPGFRRCVHLEPIGFQVPARGWLARPRNPLVRWGIDFINRRSTKRVNQNRRLYPLLIDMERRGKIKITVVRKNFCSTLLYNPTTLIVWEKPGTTQGTVSAGQARRDDRQPSLWRRLMRPAPASE
jgi:hypothetical protein